MAGMLVRDTQPSLCLLFRGYCRHDSSQNCDVSTVLLVFVFPDLRLYCLNQVSLESQPLDRLRQEDHLSSEVEGHLG